MTNTQINKAIRKIVGAEYEKTYTDPRKNGTRSKFILAPQASGSLDIATAMLHEVQAFLRTNKIKRTARLYKWYSFHASGSGWTIVTFNK